MDFVVCECGSECETCRNYMYKWILIYYSSKKVKGCLENLKDVTMCLLLLSTSRVVMQPYDCFKALGTNGLACCILRDGPQARILLTTGRIQAWASINTNRGDAARGSATSWRPRCVAFIMNAGGWNGRVAAREFPKSLGNNRKLKKTDAIVCKMRKISSLKTESRTRLLWDWEYN